MQCHLLNVSVCQYMALVSLNFIYTWCCFFTFSIVGQKTVWYFSESVTIAHALAICRYTDATIKFYKEQQASKRRKKNNNNKPPPTVRTVKTTSAKTVYCSFPHFCERIVSSEWNVQWKGYKYGYPISPTATMITITIYTFCMQKRGARESE